jgi:hypothetical protein
MTGEWRTEQALEIFHAAELLCAEPLAIGTPASNANSTEQEAAAWVKLALTTPPR